jgi:nucleotide-binding universal stress UspA family protein
MADLFDFHEDAERDQKVADPATVLTNDQLEAGGLRQVRAFVRTRASRNALRVQKHREKAAEGGLQQVNVVAPEAARDAVKEIARRTTAGEPLEAVLLDVAKAPAAPAAAPAPKVDTSTSTSEADALVIAAARRSGLRGWMIRKLAGV